MSGPICQSTLLAGQVPLHQLASAESVKHVRTLRPCPVCASLGNEPNMIEHDGWYHGRCFASKFGEEAFLALPKGQTNRVTWGDIGTELMKKLVQS
jgi:hypothetical protein